MKKWACLLVFLCGAILPSTSQNSVDFILDKSKPYVYLNFDHIGPRKPLTDGEAGIGLWLRVENNCQIPIVLQSADAPQGEPGVTLFDEVLANEPFLEITSETAEEIAAREQARLEALKRKPAGYSTETSGVVRVQPGKSILFSVPLNHVSNEWFLRVKFALDLKSSSVAVGPFTYLDFHKFDIPKEVAK
jgi:hypothetical protein